MAVKKPTNREIEQRYIENDMKVTQERSDFLLPQIIDFVSQKKWMNLQPEYQRRQVWDRAKQSRFIESLLMNLPVPPVFLYEPEYSRYEVMDGQQRLSSVLSFYENRLKLTGLEHWPELNGKHYSDLPVKVQRGVDRRRISAVVLQSNSLGANHDELRRIVFERLNTGGQKLNAQELRNCVYASPFASMLVELAGYAPFNDLLDIPRYEDHFINGQVSGELSQNLLFKRMIDCEFVLRYFSFREKKNIKGSVKKILDRCMDSYRLLGENELDGLRGDFQSRIDLAKELLGEDAFHLIDPNGNKGSLSQPYYDAIIVACDRRFSDRIALLKKKAALKKALIKATSNPDAYELIVGRANTADAIRRRLDFVEKVFAGVL
jgi:hypothetical protein